MKKGKKTELIEMGRRIRELREGKNLTQRDLSQKSGVAHATISLVERGEADLRTMKLKDIADALHASLDYLISGKPDITLAKVLETNNQLIQHIVKLVSLPHDDQMRLEDHLDLLVMRHQTSRPKKQQAGIGDDFFDSYGQVMNQGSDE